VKRSAVNVVLIIVVSLVIWIVFDNIGAPLDPPGTAVVVAFVAIVVIGTQWLVAALRQKRKPNP
jgi:hypothetical protein